MSAYEKTLEWLYALEAAKGMDFKLERVALALGRLGNPQRSYPSVHVAGTNGKGSVAAMAHSVLNAAGYRVGLYTSPHLVSLTERIRVGEDEIGRDEIVTLADELRRVVTADGIGLTFFEFLTVMAFTHFARSRVDVAVVEVGLGGRLDATNVLDPAVAVVTTIGLDHTEWLGDSIEAIAAEKGGIIKGGRPVVIGDVGPRAATVLRDIAREREAPVIEAAPLHRVDAAGRVDFAGLGWKLTGLEVGLLGAAQRVNAGTAMAALAVLSDVLPIPEKAIRTGLARVRWPGRLEIVATKPLTLVDGAHNPDGVAALVRDLPSLLEGRRPHVLFAVMRDKNWPAMVERLGPLCESVVVTEVLGQRSEPCWPVVESFARHCPAIGEPVVRHAWRIVRERSGADGAILVTGSLFLVGEIHGLLAGAPDWPVTGAVQP